MHDKIYKYVFIILFSIFNILYIFALFSKSNSLKKLSYLSNYLLLRSIKEQDNLTHAYVIRKEGLVFYDNVRLGVKKTKYFFRV